MTGHVREGAEFQGRQIARVSTWKERLLLPDKQDNYRIGLEVTHGVLLQQEISPLPVPHLKRGDLG